MGEKKKYEKFQELKIVEGEIWDDRFSTPHKMWYLGEDENFIDLYVEHEPYGQYNGKKSIYHLAKYKIEEGKVRLEEVNE